MPKYRKKPVEIEAFRLGFDEMPQWFKDHIANKPPLRFYFSFHEAPYTIIKTPEGDMKANEGDYIIKGIEGEIYPCKPEIFEKTYEKAIPLSMLTEKATGSSKTIPISGIDVDLSGGPLLIDDAAITPAKIKDMSADKVEVGKIGDILDQLKSCAFECEAGPLVNNVAFIELEKFLKEKPTITLKIDAEALERVTEAAEAISKAINPTITLDGKEIGKACAKAFTKSTKRENMRSK
nr:hypothetical protein [Bacillus glycinifermentans]